MGSVRLGSQNSRSEASSNSKPRNILGKQNNDRDNNNNNNKNNNKSDIVWSTKKRGQAIIRTGRSDAKSADITTISATRTASTLPLTPAASRRVKGDSRPYLAPHAIGRSQVKPQNQDVALMLQPVVKENTGRMGHDPSTTTRPQMASLSATRGSSRTPLTPKIASGASRSSQPHAGLSAATTASATAKSTTTTPTTTTTPSSRRTHQRPAPVLSAGSSIRAQHDDDHSVLSTNSSTPHINNSTPRSGSRQSRVDSATCTPCGTPSRDRFENWDSKSGIHPSSPLNQADSSRRPIVTFTGVSPNGISSRLDATLPRESKFFHASDIKPKPSSKNLKSSAFFYANGNDIASPPSTNPAAPLLPALSPAQSQENVSSKFMYANGTPEVSSLPPTRLTRSGSTVGSAKGSTVGSTVASHRPSVSGKQPRHTSSHRNSTGSQNGSMNPNIASATATHIRAQPPPQLGPSPPGLRRTGAATPRSGPHSRAGSLAKEESAHETLRPIASPVTGVFPAANISANHLPALGLASIIQTAEEFTEFEDDVPLDDQPPLQSPTKSSVSPPDPVTELISNARRERRVQDLEIRNGSLEAINRTLERQLRKQSAELRRLRRQSRAGTLSLVSNTMSSHGRSGSTSDVDVDALGLSSLGGEDQSATEDLEEEEEELSDTETASSDLSPSVREARDTKRGQQDERRLTVDLSNHQQILLDSQKINQSIKRCLDWTEQLIKDGRKALEYKVPVGGRVLNPLDEEEYNGTLFADDLATLDAESPEQPTELLTWYVEPQDRDSGIEMPKDEY